VIFLLPHFWRKSKAAGLAKELIEAETGRFEPAKMPDKYAETLRELLQAKIEQRAPHIEIATESKAKPEVVNIMAALKESMQEKDAPRCGMRCGDARKRRGREPYDRGQASAGRRIDFPRAECTEPRLNAGALLLSVGSYCFAAQVLVVASQTPPALSQSAFVLAIVTSPAKAGPVKARARVIAKMERRVFMVFSLYA
jgi:hypothetical protein